MPLQALVSLCFMLISSMGTVLHCTFRLRSVVDCGLSMLELILNCILPIWSGKQQHGYDNQHDLRNDSF